MLWTNRAGLYLRYRCADVPTDWPKPFIIASRASYFEPRSRPVI
jgi:hypothetical protein